MNYLNPFAGDELFSDTYKMKLVQDCLWEVYGKVKKCIHLTKVTPKKIW